MAGEVIKGGVKTLLPKSAEDSLKSGASSFAKKVLELPETKKFIQNYKEIEKSNPELARNLVATMQGGEFLINLAGLKAAKTGAEAGLKVAKTGLEAGIELGQKGLSSTGEVVTGVIDTSKNVAGKIADVGSMVKQGASEIPGRIATNFAEKQIAEKAIKELPSELAQSAVRSGIDIADVRSLGSMSLNGTERTIAKKLLDSAKRFSSGFRDAEPGSVVGETITNSLKELESLKTTVGKEIGEVSKSLGKVTTEELQPAILTRLQQVNGLEGLTRTPAGVLNFDNTLLRTAENKTTREAIRKLFDQAIMSETGSKKNLLRQELFEILGGKKKSLANITDTGEKAYEAIRQGLADVLDTKNSSYKALNEKYAMINQPVRDMRKLLKAADPSISTDILSESAGTLARRLTSNAISKGEIGRILESIDSILSVAGKETASTKKMQDLYNVLNSYYDIAPKAGFQAGVKSGVEGAIGGGISDTITGAIKNVAGETQAVRQKALEKLLEGLLKG